PLDQPKRTGIADAAAANSAGEPTARRNRGLRGRVRGRDALPAQPQERSPRRQEAGRRRSTRVRRDWTGQRHHHAHPPPRLDRARLAPRRRGRPDPHQEPRRPVLNDLDRPTAALLPIRRPRPRLTGPYNALHGQGMESGPVVHMPRLVIRRCRSAQHRSSSSAQAYVHPRSPRGQGGGPVPNSNRKPPASSNEPDPPLSSTLGRALPPEQRQRLQAAAGDAAASRLRAYHDQHGHEPNEVVHSDQKRAKDRAREARQQKRRKAAGRKAASETPLPLDLDSPDLQRTAQE